MIQYFIRKGFFMFIEGYEDVEIDRYGDGMWTDIQRITVYTPQGHIAFFNMLGFVEKDLLNSTLIILVVNTVLYLYLVYKGDKINYEESLYSGARMVTLVVLIPSIIINLCFKFS